MSSRSKRTKRVVVAIPSYATTAGWWSLTARVVPEGVGVRASSYRSRWLRR